MIIYRPVYSNGVGYYKHYEERYGHCYTNRLDAEKEILASGFILNPEDDQTYVFAFLNERQTNIAFHYYEDVFEENEDIAQNEHLHGLFFNWEDCMIYIQEVHVKDCFKEEYLEK